MSVAFVSLKVTLQVFQSHRRYPCKLLPIYKLCAHSVLRSPLKLKSEKGRDAQRRLVDDFYNSVEEWDAI